MATQVDKLQQTYPATPESVVRARRTLDAFARAAGIREDRLDDLRLAGSEALTNAVQHAYRHDTEAGTVTLTAFRTDEELWVLVSDQGCGLTPRDDSPGLGLGLGLIMQVADSFEVSHDLGRGTEIRMSFPVSPRAAAPRAHPGGERRSSETPAQRRGSRASASSPASSSFSTIT